MAVSDLRQPAARLHPPADRRRAGPALGPDQGAGRLTGHRLNIEFQENRYATPRRHPHRADRQRTGHRHRMALSAARRDGLAPPWHELCGGPADHRPPAAGHAQRPGHQPAHHGCGVLPAGRRGTQRHQPQRHGIRVRRDRTQAGMSPTHLASTVTV
ncbi:hypothetical protein LJR001_002046 [Achromobacter mucicolens]